MRYISIKGQQIKALVSLLHLDRSLAKQTSKGMQASGAIAVHNVNFTCVRWGLTAEVEADTGDPDCIAGEVVREDQNGEAQQERSCSHGPHGVHRRSCPGINRCPHPVQGQAFIPREGPQGSAQQHPGLRGLKERVTLACRKWCDFCPFTPRSRNPPTCHASLFLWCNRTKLEDKRLHVSIAYIQQWTLYLLLQNASSVCSQACLVLCHPWLAGDQVKSEHCHSTTIRYTRVNITLGSIL